MRLLTFRIIRSVRIERRSRSNEEKKRDPRFLEEEEGAAAASRGAGRDEGPATTTARTSGQIGEAAGNLDEIRTQRIIG
jgi:hypothetical protein